MKWSDSPVSVDFIPKSIDYIAGIDESGTSDFKKIDEAKNKGIEVDTCDRHFTVTAPLISMNDFERSREMVMELKYKYWTDGLYKYNGNEKRVCFHSRDIRRREGAFSADLIEYNDFITDLSQMMRDIPLTLFVSHIDKQRCSDRYRWRMAPYDLCMTFIFERIVMNIPSGKSCVIIIESREKKRDAELHGFIMNLLEYGTQYIPAEKFNKIKGVYFNSKWCAKENNRLSYWELELADLCAYPFYKYFAYGTQDMAFKTLLPKLNLYPYYDGTGLKSFP